ncbi:hypothetical protein [Nocardia brasiliensis]|uniref:hypothetical protein n=1 Tax=Nocardia brasiliensis TaxID=37326 RepID=UPI001892DE21|nr:hypothetical protein [Nocardia brasiliensis]MBF6127545.1 hypothetical protein [Nocardia brasiliensis]
MEPDSNLEDLRSALSCVYEKLGAESLTEPDRVELVARAEVVQAQIDAIQYAVGDEAAARIGDAPVPETDPLF